MNLMFLTQQGGILKPFAWVMGIILNGIYEFMSLFHVYNIAICIVIFTFVVKMLMLPLIIKQQKFTRLSSKMNPELTKVQNKYKNKNTKDPDVARKQQAEIQEVYNKYGTNPLGGCLPLLITLPIMFALYRVIYAVPAYVNDIKDMYMLIADAVHEVPDYVALISSNFNLTVKNFEGTTIQLIDVFSKFTGENWTALFDIEAFSGVQSVMVSLDGVSMTIAEVVDKILNINGFIFGMNILESPGWGFPGIIIPLLSTGLYFLQSKLLTANNGNNGNDQNNAMAQNMKVMNTVMPVMSGLFCVYMPIGVGIYWIASSAFQIIQQILINKYLDKADLDEMIEKNMEKSEKKKQKQGVDRGSKMAAVAKTSTRAIETEKETTVKPAPIKKKNQETSNYKKSEVSYSANSISANANILNRNNNTKSNNKKENNINIEKGENE